MKRHLFILLACIAITHCVYSQATKTPNTATDAIPIPKTSGLVKESAKVDTVQLPIVNGKFNIGIQIESDGKLSAGTITITQNGKPFKTVESTGLKYLFALDINSHYLVKCTKPGYIAKTIFIDTKIPAGRETRYFAKFTARIELFKDDGKQEVINKPVGGIIYSIESDDFDYDKNYK